MSRLERKKSDWIVTIGVIAVIFAIYGTMVIQFRARLHEEALINELRSLRLAVVTFYYINNRNPKDLQELVDAVFKTTKGTERALVSDRLKQRGLTDPFGNPYVYDREAGWISTATKDYKDW